MIFVNRTLFILTGVFSHHNKQNKFRKVMKIRLLVWNVVLVMAMFSTHRNIPLHRKWVSYPTEMELYRLMSKHSKYALSIDSGTNVT